MPEQSILGGFEDLVKIDTKAKLEAKFIIPPFSVWDTRQGYWQDRKRLWLELGVKSEIGRSGNLTYTGKVADIHAYDGQSKVDRYSEAGRDPNLLFKAKEVTSQNLNYYRKKEKAEEKGEEKGFYDSVIAERGGGTSIFDPVVCELCYKWFCPQGGMILDPFAGGSVRGITAHILGYKYYGIDLSQEQVAANQAQAELITPESKPTWIIGNSVDMDKLLPKKEGFYGNTNVATFDFVFSCPPYFDLEQYSNNEMDLSTMKWSDFKDDYSNIIYKAAQNLKFGRFACFVVSEVRDDKGFYRGLVPFTIAAFKRANMQFYNEIILVNQVGSMPIRIKNMFGSYRKIGRVHQNILVFYNGRTEDIPRYFKEIEIKLPD